MASAVRAASSRRSRTPSTRARTTFPTTRRGRARPLPSVRMDRDAFDAYLNDARHRGEPLVGGFDGAAGGAPCGDLIRVSIAIERGSVVAVTVDAEGCAAARAAAAVVA